MKRVILVAALFVAGALAGGFVEHSIYDEGRQECVSSAALKGCELVATDVHNMLTECQWELGDVKHRLIQQLEREQTILKTFMPSAFE